MRGVTPLVLTGLAAIACGASSLDSAAEEGPGLGGAATDDDDDVSAGSGGRSTRPPPDNVGGMVGAGSSLGTGGTVAPPRDPCPNGLCEPGGPCGDDLTCPCSPGLKLCGGLCIQPAPTLGCSLDTCAPCPPGPPNSSSICVGQACSWLCHDGYRVTGDRCIPVEDATVCPPGFVRGRTGCVPLSDAGVPSRTDGGPADAAGGPDAPPVEPDALPPGDSGDPDGSEGGPGSDAGGGSSQDAGFDAAGCGDACIDGG